ncbi:MAG TPA: helix-turn-helix transcriptional regulator [Lapillicoccus sp.]|nr:helix-turn-helix transcriptional regulator [Lapillicoccus sp.]
MALPDVPTSDLIDEDPRETISRLIAVEEDRLRRRQADLATARNALVRLHGLGAANDVPAIAPITVEVAPTLLRSLLDETDGPVRNVVMRKDVGSGTDLDWMAYNLEMVRGGKEQRTVYDDSVLDNPAVANELADWAVAGERQRILAGVPNEFVVYGDVAVVGPEVWGDPESQYVVVRDRMLVHAFMEVFDRMWAMASPVPSRRTSDVAEDDHLLALLSRGFKDEAIARYLGWSLRTVRRRVARLMDDLGAKTRFQLGAEAVRAGRLDVPTTGTDAYQGSGPAPVQLGHRELSG